MKTVFLHCILASAFIFTTNVNAEPQNSYSTNQNFQIKLIEKMSQQNTPPQLKLNQNNAKTMLHSIQNNQTITDEQITKSALLQVHIPPPPSPLSTIGDENGPIVISKYPSFKNGLIEAISPGPSPDEKSEMKDSSNGCKGEFKTLSTGLTKQAIKKCFVQLDELSAIVSPETSGEKTYLRALPAVTSIVDKNQKHQCIASYYAQGIWITAGHCLSYQSISIGRWLLISGNMVQITNTESACPPNTSCDITLIKLPTPVLNKADTPYISLDTSDLNTNTKPFIPGIPVDTHLKDSSNGLSYRKELMWSPVGKGYCRMLTIEKSGCIVHSCSTLSGFSGAPIYSYDEKNDQIKLIGVHSGDDPKKNNCTATAQANFAYALAHKGN